MHLCHGLFGLGDVFGWLEVFEVTGDRICGIYSLSSGKNFPHFSWVEAVHGILSELEGLIDLAAGHFRDTSEVGRAVVVVGSMHTRNEGVIGLLVRHWSNGRRVLRHNHIMRRCGSVGTLVVTWLLSSNDWVWEVPGRLVFGSLGSISLLEKFHLFFSRLLLGLILIFKILHLFFKLS